MPAAGCYAPRAGGQPHGEGQGGAQLVRTDVARGRLAAAGLAAEGDPRRRPMDVRDGHSGGGVVATRTPAGARRLAIWNSLPNAGQPGSKLAAVRGRCDVESLRGE